MIKINNELVLGLKLEMVRKMIAKGAGFYSGHDRYHPTLHVQSISRHRMRPPTAHLL